MRTQLLTKKELAKLLAVSPRTVENWIAQRKLPTVRFGKNVVRFKESDIEAWIQRRTVKNIAV